MRTPNLIFCLVVFAISSNLLVAQMPFGKMNATNGEGVSFSMPSKSSEQPEKRGLYQNVYKTADGRVVYEYCKAPLNYKSKQGQWEHVDVTPTTTAQGFLAEKQNNPVALGFDGSVEIASPEGSLFTVKTMSIFGAPVVDVELGNKKIHPALVTAKNQYFNFLTEQTIQRSEFRHNGMKVDYIFMDPVSTNGGVIKQQLVCNSNFKLSKHNLIKHALTITNANGEEVGILYPIICKDAGGNISLGQYSFQKNDQGYEVSMQLDNEWLNASERTYPLIVDPLIVGPTALWGAVYMPSCVVPVYNEDSLLVTLPGQTTITGVFVSASYYADPFSGAIMADGQMHFSTSCAQTGNLTVLPPIGNSAGTAYLDNFDYRSPLTCCMGPSCVDRTFYIRMHLGRTTGGGATCNTSYLYYDAFTLYPFKVYVEGHTVEATGAQWTVTPTTLCSDVCDFTFKPLIRYGVPPFTITHPWAAGPTNMGAPVFTCALSTTTGDIPVTRPGCPIYCDTTTVINIPLPTITDACGNTVSGLPVRTITIKPTPQITIATDSILVCANDPAQYNFVVCPAGTVVNWSTPGFIGFNSIDTAYANLGPGVIQTTYAASATLNGCVAIPDTFSFYVSPNPVAASNHPLVGQILEPLPFVDMSNYDVSSGSTWYWTFGDGNTDTDSATTHQYLAPGTYNVCLYITSDFGCMDTICDTIKIIPNNLTLPNVLTTNSDGINDALYFQYLPYYGISTLSVFNRWGEIIYESEDYQNNWTPTNLVDGTYFYIVTIPGHDPYTSTLTVFNKL